jgi:hypothetical protein
MRSYYKKPDLAQETSTKQARDAEARRYAKLQAQHRLVLRLWFWSTVILGALITLLIVR